MFAVRIVALMFVTMALAALAIDGSFSALGLIPDGPRPSRGAIFGSIQLDYKFLLNVVGLVAFAGFFMLTARRGVTDVVCHMRVDRAKGSDQGRGGREVLFLLGALPARVRERRVARQEQLSNVVDDIG